MCIQVAFRRFPEKTSKPLLSRKFKFKTIDNLVNALEKEPNITIHKGMVSRWENGKQEPTKNIQALAACLNVSTSYLIGEVTLGNAIMYLRFMNHLTIEELSKKSGI